MAELAVFGFAAALLGWALLADERWLRRHVLPDFFTPPSVQVAWFGAARIAAGVAAVMLLILVRPRVGRLLETVPLRRIFLMAAPSLVAVVLAIGVSELLLERLPQLGAADVVVHPEPLRRRDPELGWVLRAPRTALDTVGGRRIAYGLDPRGYRVRQAGQAIDPAKPTILFAGESILFGHGLTWDESLAGQLEALTGAQSADLAVEGYATDQAYLRLRRELPRFQRPVAVVGIFMPGLMPRSLETGRPHLDPGLVWRPATPQWRLTQIARWLAPYRTEAEVERGVAVTRDAFAGMVVLAASRGATAVILAPQLAPETVAERDLRRRVLDQARLPYVLVRLDPNWRIAGDGHPDARAARAMASALAAYLQVRSGSSRPAAPP